MRKRIFLIGTSGGGKSTLMKKHVDGIGESSTVMFLEKLKQDKDTALIEIRHPRAENARRQLELWAEEYT